MRLIREFEGAEHIAVVRQRNPFLTVFLRLVHHGADIGGSIEQGKLGMAMQMDEFRHDVSVLKQGPNYSIPDLGD